MTAPAPYRSPSRTIDVSCLSCGLDGHPGATCKGCGSELPALSGDAVRANAPCPRCGTAMLPVAPDTTSVLHVCQRCCGMFVPPLAFHALLASPDRVEALEARLPKAPKAPAALVSMIRCPVCSAEMDRLRFAAVSDVVVDVCARRHGIWLDAGELGSVLRFTLRRDEVGTARIAHHADAAMVHERLQRVIDEAARMRRIDQIAATVDVSSRTRRKDQSWGILVFILVAIGAGRRGACSRRTPAP